MPVSDLFAVKTYTENDVSEALFYNESWLVVHYLFDKDKMSGLEKYMELTFAQHVPIPAAIEQAFNMTPKKFDAELAAYLNMGQRQIFNIDDSTSVDSENITAEPLDSNDASALIADLNFHMPDRRKEAIEEFKAALNKNPYQEEANLGLGYDAFLQKRFDDAESFFRKALSRDPKSARANLLFGILQYRRDSTDQTRQEYLLDAWNHLSIATRSNPELANAHSVLASVLEKLGDKAGALAEAKLAARLDQGDERYFVDLAEMCFNAKKYAEAKILFEQLASSSDSSVSSLANKRLEELKSEEEQQKTSTQRD
jgi:tetratricopeptide (TPR) repeat protein